MDLKQEVKIETTQLTTEYNTVLLMKIYLRKLFFTYGIGKRRVERIVRWPQKCTSVSNDNRGKHNNKPNKISDHIIRKLTNTLKASMFEYLTTAEKIVHSSSDLKIDEMHNFFRKTWTWRIGQIRTRWIM